DLRRDRGAKAAIPQAFGTRALRRRRFHGARQASGQRRTRPRSAQRKLTTRLQTAKDFASAELRKALWLLLELRRLALRLRPLLGLHARGRRCRRWIGRLFGGDGLGT